jgi:hypothetical protein
MSQEKCKYCNSTDLATVKGELICTSCGLVNKTALENKERYVSPTFYQKRKLGKERRESERKNTLNQIRTDISYIANFLDLTDATQKQANDNALEILTKERKVYPDFPWVTRTPQWNYNCFIALSVLVAIENIMGDYKEKAKIFDFFFNRGEEITKNDINQFVESLTSKYNFVVDL